MTKQLFAPALILLAGLASAGEISNPRIDYGAFKTNVERVGERRELHRVTEAEFLQMAADPDTVIYGYLNAYELGPLIDIHKTMIPFERDQRVVVTR